MATLSETALREAFHLLFLERLFLTAAPSQFVLKGGVNLRFFFASPRYSEDMDLDVLAGSVETLKKNDFKILEDNSLLRAMQAFGVTAIRVSFDGSFASKSCWTQFAPRSCLASKR